MRKENGITLISIVITIIVLIILASIGISILTGDSGMIGKSKEAERETEKSEEEEIIKLSEAQAAALDVYGVVTRGKLEEKLDKNKGNREYKLEANAEETEFKITFTKGSKFHTEHYIYTEKVDRVESGTGSSEVKGGIVFSNEIWSGGTATVKLSTETIYRIQYQINSTEEGWITGEEVTGLKYGDIIYARLWNGRNAGEVVNKTVEDTIPPVVNIGTTKTTNSITVNVTVSDKESGMDSIVTYTYIIKEKGETENKETVSNITSSSYTFSGLKQETEYEITVMVGKDKAGNTGEGTITVSTGILEGDIKFSNAVWTEGTASVTMSTPTSYTIQYQLNGTEGTWTTGTSVSGLTHNNVIYARLYDGINVTTSYATYTVKDGVAPTIESAVGSTTTGNTGTVTVSGVADTGGSGLKAYYISTSSTTPTKDSVTWIDNTESSFTETVSANGTYNVWVIDKQGNVSAVKSCTVSGIVDKVKITGYTGITLLVGNTGTPSLTFSGTPKSTSYSSSDTSIATINSSSGLVKGIKAGTATMTATLTNYDGTTVSKTCTVTVNNGNVMIASTGVHYTDLANAISASTSGDTLQVVQDYTDSSTATISKDLTLNTNGKTLTKNSYGITVNSGCTVTLSGSGTLTTPAGMRLITNNGTLNVTHTGIISSTDATKVVYLLYNTGTLTISGKCNLNCSYGMAINNTGTVNYNNATATVSGQPNSGPTVWNKGTFNMSGGTLNYTTSDNGSNIINDGTLNMSAGTLSSTGYALVTRNNGITTVTGGTIKSTSSSYPAVQTEGLGRAIISNTTINGSTNAVALTDNNDGVKGKSIHLFDCTIKGNVGNWVDGGGVIIEMVKTSTGYTIYYYDRNNIATKVQFPTWTEYNGQDDLKNPWYEGSVTTRNGSKVFYYNINKANHNNELGSYITHVYADGQLMEMITYNLK